MIDTIIEKFKERDEVDAILLGGSRATNSHDSDSDYDLYVYLNRQLDEKVRKNILKDYVSFMEYSNHFWELEDDGVLLNGIEVEFIYRDFEFIQSVLKNLKEKTVGNGYTTCFLDNVLDSKILFDKTGKLQQLKEEYKDVLDDELVQAIINQNVPLLNDRVPALYFQIKKAVKRNDLHSINHRLTEYFAIYYDVLFALNKEPHPGEKRLIEYACNLNSLPKNYRVDVENVFDKVFRDNDEVVKTIYNMSENIKELVVHLGYKLT